MIILMKIVVFILGYLTIRMGYHLISSGAEGKFKFAANLGGFKADLVSVSPGLLFVLLGIMLIGIALYIDKSISMKSKDEPIHVITQPPPPILSPIDENEKKEQ